MMHYKYGVFFSTLQTEERLFSKHFSHKNASKAAYRLNGIGQGLVAKVRKLKAPKVKFLVFGRINCAKPVKVKLIDGSNLEIQ